MITADVKESGKMKTEFVLALVIAIMLGGVMHAMAGNGDASLTDTQQANNVTYNELCEDAACLIPADECTENVLPCDTNEDGKDDCWCCETNLTTCVLPLES